MPSEIRQELAIVQLLGNERRLATIVNQLARVAPPGHDPEKWAARYARVAYTEVRRNTRLAQCSEASFLGCLMDAAALGLEPGPLGHVYLIPYSGEAKLIIGYKGIVRMAWDSARVSLVARTVYEGDFFEVEFGTRPELVHRPVFTDRGSPRLWYGVATLPDKRSLVHVMTLDEIEDRKKRSKSAKSPDSPWNTDEESMRRKTVIRAMTAMLPLSSNVATGLEMDEDGDTGRAPMLGNGDLARIAAGVTPDRELDKEGA